MIKPSTPNKGWKMTPAEIEESADQSRIAREKAIREQGPISHEEAVAQALASRELAPYVHKSERRLSGGQETTEQ